MKPSATNRGMIMLYVMVLGALLGVFIYLMLEVAQVDSVNRAVGRMEREGQTLEASARVAAAAAIHEAVLDGDIYQSQSNLSAALGQLSLQMTLDQSEWGSVTALSLTGLPSPLFDKTPGSRLAGTPTKLSALGGYGLVQSALETEATLSYSLSSLGSPTLSRPFSRKLVLAEIPSAEFQLISTSRAFDADRSGAITVSGKALFNAGLVRTHGGGALAVSGYSIVPAGLPAVTTGLNIVPGASPVANWGGDPLLLVSDDAGVSHAVWQSYALATHLDGTVKRTLRYLDPGLAPVDLPAAGISVQTRMGEPRLVINLDTYVSDRALYVDCDADTQENGILIEGGSDAAMELVSIVTNGRVILSGTNLRPTVIGSSYGSPVLLSSAYVEGASGSAATAAAWNGFWVFPFEDLTLDSPENWSGVTYSLNGGLLFKGGALVFPGSLFISRNPDLSLVLARDYSGPMSDRFLVVQP